MVHKKNKNERSSASLASVKMEMAKTRMARSAKIAELKLDTSRIPQRPSTAMPGTVNKIVQSSGPNQPEKAQITVDVPDRKYRDLRIDNLLTDERGCDVKLKKGAHVEVTITEDQKE
ncbi:MAG TPA: hypothetical protein VNI36_10870 [Candidatus Dormibacteraeota bacterium]|nr:hypothetical protein [Candidatus Dormibacteraeota bacterium]